MLRASAGEGFVPRRLTTVAVAAVVAASLGLYQATSLLLGRAIVRQITLSLSTPSLEESPMPAPPAAQVLELGQAVAGRVERGLAALPFALRPPQRPADPQRGNAAPAAAPSVAAHGPVTIPVGRIPNAGHDGPSVLPGGPHPAWTSEIGRLSRLTQS